jgi:hypothetical protein
MMNVSEAGGAILTILRIRAPISPASSASPTPIMATMITPTAEKSLKFCTKLVKMNRIPSALSRFFTAMVSVCRS